MTKKVVIVVGAILALVVLVRLARPERHVANAGERHRPRRPRHLRSSIVCWLRSRSIRTSSSGKF